MAYSEKQFASEFAKYLRTLPQGYDLKKSMALEYKVKKVGKKLHLIRDFQPQQIPYLHMAKTSCVYKKLSDLDPSLKPFDAMQLCYVDAYVVVCWYEPKKKKNVYLMAIDTVMKLLNDGQNLLDEDMVFKHAAHSFQL